MMQAKVIPAQIREAYPVLVALHDLEPKLTFAKSLLRKALALIQDELKKRPGWSLRPEHHNDWVDTMACRLSNLCRVLTQGENKHPACS